MSERTFTNRVYNICKLCKHARLYIREIVCTRTFDTQDNYTQAYDANGIYHRLDNEWEPLIPELSKTRFEEQIVPYECDDPTMVTLRRLREL